MPGEWRDALLRAGLGLPGALRSFASRLVSEASTLGALIPPPDIDLSPAAVAAWPAWKGGECARCGAFTGEAPVAACAACAGFPPPFAARSLFPYDGPAGEAIRAIKYSRRPVPASAIAERLVTEGIRGRWSALFPPDFHPIVVPVPIRPPKYLLRGFNLPSLVACALARLAGWRIEAALLERTFEAGAQAGLRQAERHRNIEDAFRVSRGGRPPPQVLLLDDVLTSGATAAACARALKRGGAQHIVVLTVARAVRTHPTRGQETR